MANLQAPFIVTGDESAVQALSLNPSTGARRRLHRRVERCIVGRAQKLNADDLITMIFLQVSH